MMKKEGRIVGRNFGQKKNEMSFQYLCEDFKF